MYILIHIIYLFCCWDIFFSRIFAIITLHAIFVYFNWATSRAFLSVAENLSLYKNSMIKRLADEETAGEKSGTELRWNLGSSRRKIW